MVVLAPQQLILILVLLVTGQHIQMMGVVGEVGAVVSQILSGHIEETSVLHVSDTVLSINWSATKCRA